VLPEFRDALVSSSTRQLTKLREEIGMDAEFFIGSGGVSNVLAHAAKQTGADVVVIGRRASINRLGANNYAIIRDSPVAVLSV
jgi:nucleotide-binding universal stress UspA family protein